MLQWNYDRNTGWFADSRDKQVRQWWIRVNEKGEFAASPNHSDIPKSSRHRTLDDAKLWCQVKEPRVTFKDLKDGDWFLHHPSGGTTRWQKIKQVDTSNCVDTDRALFGFVFDEAEVTPLTVKLEVVEKC